MYYPPTKRRTNVLHLNESLWIIPDIPQLPIVSSDGHQVNSNYTIIGRIEEFDEILVQAHACISGK